MAVFAVTAVVQTPAQVAAAVNGGVVVTAIVNGGVGPGSGVVNDPDIITIGELDPPDDSIIQRKAGAWTDRTLAQYAEDLYDQAAFTGAYVALGPAPTGVAATDTAALTAALAALPDGGRLHLQPGEYVITPSTVPGLASGIHLIGAGQEATRISMAPNTASGAGIFYILTCAATATDIEVEGITFDGNRDDGNHGLSENIAGLWFSNVQRCSVHHCRFTNFRSEGFYAAKGAGVQPSYISITDCDFDDLGYLEVGDAGLPRQGLAIISGDHLTISGNHFVDIADYCIDLEANTGTETFNDVVIADNTCDGCDAMVNVAPTTVANATNVAVTGNVGSNIGESGIDVKATGATIAGNVVPDADKWGVRVLSGSLRVAVTGNTLRITGTDSTYAPIQVDSATYCTVVGNTLLGTGGAAGVREIGTSDFNFFAANAIEDSTRYATVGAATWTDAVLRGTLSLTTHLVFLGASGNIEHATEVLNLIGTQVITKIGVTEAFRANASAMLIPGAHNARDLGITGTRWRTGFFAGKVQATGGIGVGNSAAATTPGTVTKKMEVFDADGASLGFVAIYDAIT